MPVTDDVRGSQVSAEKKRPDSPRRNERQESDETAGGLPTRIFFSRSASAADRGTTRSAKTKADAPVTTARTRMDAVARNRETPFARSAVVSADRTRLATAMRAAAENASGTTSTRIGASFAWK